MDPAKGPDPFGLLFPLSLLSGIQCCGSGSAWIRNFFPIQIRNFHNRSGLVEEKCSENFHNEKLDFLLKIELKYLVSFCPSRLGGIS